MSLFFCKDSEVDNDKSRLVAGSCVLGYMLVEYFVITTFFRRRGILLVLLL